MILFELLGRSEAHPVYHELAVSNLARHYDFLKSLITAAVRAEHRRLSHEIIKALNYHAIACLHHHAGQHRPGAVVVGEGEDAYHPPDHDAVPELMDDFVTDVNGRWVGADPIQLAAYCIWRLNNIHPFVNGNGRTARAVGHYVLCVQMGGPLPGRMLPVLIKDRRDEYVRLLRQIDGADEDDPQRLEGLSRFIGRLVSQEIARARRN